MLLYQTTKAHRELAPGAARLNLRERSLLLLANGVPRAQLERLFHGQGAALVAQLLQAGYLAAHATQIDPPDSSPVTDSSLEAPEP